VPAVLVGSLLSSRAPDRYIRPAITFVIFASGLKYVGVPTYPLGFAMGGILVAGLAYLAVRSGARRAADAADPDAEAGAGAAVTGAAVAGAARAAPALAERDLTERSGARGT
jgi:hypothetical protein